MRIEVDTSGLTSLGQQVGLLTGDQVARATARALKATGVATRDHLRAELAKPTGGPIEGGATRWTIGGTYATPFVRPAELMTEVGFASTQPHAAGRYLRPLLTATGPVIKASDLKIADGQRLSYLPARDMPRTAQGNVTRATLGSRVINSKPFQIPLRDDKGIGLFVRVKYKRRASRLRLVGVLVRGRPRQQTLRLREMLEPVVQREFAERFANEIRASLQRAGLS